MDYNKLYQRFIESRPARKKVSGDGLETHHILPRSLGGLDTADNRVVLTAREHFIAHRLLHKFATGMDKSRMAFALKRMAHDPRRNYRFTSRQYEQVKIAVREAYKIYRSRRVYTAEEKMQRSQRALAMWRDPTYRSKFTKTQPGETPWSRCRLGLSKYTHNRTPQQRIQDLVAKWDSKGIPHNQTYIRSILRKQ